MSLARAFTKRGKRPEVSAPMPYYGDGGGMKTKNAEESPKSKGHTRFNSGTIKRGNISGPVQLISTTNMLAYNAPDLNVRLNTQAIPPLDPLSASADSSASSLRSRHDWEAAPSPHDYSSAITTPDESSPKTFLIDDNSYFPKRTATVGSQPRSSTTSASSMDAPKPPQRALSHTKRSHQELARQRSLSRLSPPPLAPPMHASRSNPGIRASQEIFNPESHPFSKELEQVNEVAEEFGTLHVLDEEELLLNQKGLHKFSVEDYLLEVEELYGSIFNDKTARANMNRWL